VQGLERFLAGAATLDVGLDRFALGAAQLLGQ
jgi:hypothetical protein